MTTVADQTIHVTAENSSQHVDLTPRITANTLPRHSRRYICRSVQLKSTAAKSILDSQIENFYVTGGNSSRHVDLTPRSLTGTHSQESVLCATQSLIYLRSGKAYERHRHLNSW